MTCCSENLNAYLKTWKPKMQKGKTQHDASRHHPQKRHVFGGKLVPLEPRWNTTLEPGDRQGRRYARPGLLFSLILPHGWGAGRQQHSVAAERSLGNKTQDWRQQGERRGGGREGQGSSKVIAGTSTYHWHLSSPHCQWNLNLAQGLFCPCKSSFNFSYLILERNWLLTEWECPCNIANS